MTKIKPTEARQGVIGHKVRFVLLASLVLAVIAMFAVGLIVS